VVFTGRLERERIPAVLACSDACLVGNLMVDTLLRHRRRSAESPILGVLGLRARTYALLTLHRPSNVDDRARLAGLLDAVDAVQRELPVVLPLHPRLQAALGRFGLGPRLSALPAVQATDPLGYHDFTRLVGEAGVVLTDSGGVQDETTILGVPCLTLRENTERPVTVELGTNRLAGCATDGIVAAFRQAMAEPRAGGTPPFWDGGPAGHIVPVLAAELPRLRAARRVPWEA